MAHGGARRRRRPIRKRRPLSSECSFPWCGAENQGFSQCVACKVIAFRAERKPFLKKFNDENKVMRSGSFDFDSDWAAAASASISTRWSPRRRWLALLARLTQQRGEREGIGEVEHALRDEARYRCPRANKPRAAPSPRIFDAASSSGWVAVRISAPFVRCTPP